MTRLMIRPGIITAAGNQPKWMKEVLGLPVFSPDAVRREGICIHAD